MDRARRLVLRLAFFAGRRPGKELSMPRGTWLLALSGAFALQAGGISAADPTPGPVTTRYSRPAAPPTKNYYEALFGPTESSSDESTSAAANAPSADAKVPTSTTPAKTAAAPPVPDEDI